MSKLCLLLILVAALVAAGCALFRQPGLHSGQGLGAERLSGRAWFGGRELGSSQPGRFLRRIYGAVIRALRLSQRSGSAPHPAGWPGSGSITLVFPTRTLPCSFTPKTRLLIIATGRGLHPGNPPEHQRVGDGRGFQAIRREIRRGPGSSAGELNVPDPPHFAGDEAVIGPVFHPIHDVVHAVESARPRGTGESGRGCRH